MSRVIPVLLPARRLKLAFLYSSLYVSIFDSVSTLTSVCICKTEQKKEPRYAVRPSFEPAPAGGYSAPVVMGPPHGRLPRRQMTTNPLDNVLVTKLRWH